MRLLVIDTALGACTVGVFDNGQALAIRSEPMAKGHSERIGGFVRDTMAEADIGFATLDRIGVTVGPGSFTGLRVGLSFAQGLGEALDRPVIGLSTLRALAASCHAEDGGPVAAVIDARRGQVYLQAFDYGHPLIAPQALDLDAAINQLDRIGCRRMVGTGASVLRAWRSSGSLDTDATETNPLVDPTPQALAALTQSADPADNLPRPLYLRAPDATPPTRLPGQPRPSIGR